MTNAAWEGALFRPFLLHGKGLGREPCAVRREGPSWGQGRSAPRRRHAGEPGQATAGGGKAAPGLGACRGGIPALKGHVVASGKNKTKT